MATSNQIQEISYTPSTRKFIPPTYTLGYLIIVVGVTITTSLVILSGNYSAWQVDSEKIIQEKQWYRLFTSPFAVVSFLDLSFMLISFLWLLFTVTQYENRNSTIYTIYHFWKANILIGLGVSGLDLALYSITKMKIFIMNSGGIYPYALHMYLKICLDRPASIVNHWFLPIPINRWIMGYLVSLLSVLLAPETQGCMVVHLNYLYCSCLVLIKYVTGLKCFYYEGPFLPIIFYLIEKLFPKCITAHYGFCSMQEYYRKQQQLREQEKKQTQLVQQKYQTQKQQNLEEVN